MTRHLTRDEWDMTDGRSFMKTPVTEEGLFRYDHLPPLEAALRAWNDPGVNPEYHDYMKRRVSDLMPLLARALDRAASEESKR